MAPRKYETTQESAGQAYELGDSQAALTAAIQCIHTDTQAIGAQALGEEMPRRIQYAVEQRAVAGLEPGDSAPFEKYFLFSRKHGHV